MCAELQRIKEKTKNCARITKEEGKENYVIIINNKRREEKMRNYL